MIDLPDDPNFDQAFHYTLVNEGGFVNDPDDAGGATRWGITINSLAAWRGHPVEAIDVRNLSVDEAKEIYYGRYWAPLRCHRMKQLPVAMAIFDVAVLFGLGTAAIYAQKAVRDCAMDIEVDGDIGPESLNALNVVTPSVFLSTLSTLLLGRIDGIIQASPIDERFRAGWTARVNKLLLLASS